MYITHHRGVVDRRMIASLWMLHELSMAARPRGPGADTIDGDGFARMLADCDNRVWVLHDDDRPVASCLIASRAALDQHLSREYFQDHHPDHVRRNAVQMVAWLDVHPDVDARVATDRLADCVTAMAESEGSVLVLDTHEVYDRAGAACASSSVSLMARSMRSTHDVDVQRFYVVDFAEPAAAAAACADERAEPALRRVV